MRYYSTINNVKSSEWGLTIQQAYLFSWFYEIPSWASKVMIENETYFFASKTKAIEELPILTTKPDTMYRYYKQLEELGLIVVKKIDSKDYISLTDKGKTWNFSKSDNSENNPSNVGNPSENNSENNPTYNIYNTNNNTKDIKEPKDSVGLDFDKLLEFYNTTFNRKIRVVSVKAKKNFRDRLKEGYIKEDILNVFKNVKASKWHIDKNFEVATLEFLGRSQTFEMHSSRAEKPKPVQGYQNF